MSLFPAYEGHKSSDSEACEITRSNIDTDWLKNSSFRTGTICQQPQQRSSGSLDHVSKQILSSLCQDVDEIVSLDSRSSSEEYEVLTKTKKYSARDKPKIDYPLDVRNVYYEDKKPNMFNCTADALPAKARGNFIMWRCSLGFKPWHMEMKKEIVERYFGKNNDNPDQMIKPDSVVKRGAAKTSDGREENFLKILDYLPNGEDEKLFVTREFNEKLANSPHNIELWLSYVKFQDVAERFVRAHSRENKKAICERKLSIVERGLEKNSNSKELLREKLCLMGELYPADQFSCRIEALVYKDTGNLLLWQAFIMATQTSVAMCTVPKVMNIYMRFFSTLRLGSRTSSRDHDERLLEMLYYCFVFLRQAGLWEQMWETLRLNLSLNLSLSKDALRFQRSIDEKKLIELEEVILTSGLPLNQLWLRVDSLRENCHWIGVDRDQLEMIGDSHRFVSPEDVTDFVHPMLTRHSNMRLAIFALMTLKVPLLPTSHSILKDLGLDKCSWTIDSIESILPMLYPSVGMLAGFKQRKLLLKGLLAGGLTSGPQYLRYHPAQEPYLDFIRDTFRVIADSLSPVHRTSLYVWWLRFERMIVYICKEEPKSENRRKKMKGLLKEFLKKGENRDNLHFYREYALIEREMGNYDSCVNILEMAIQSASITSEEEQNSVLNLRRTLMEILLDVRYYNETKRSRVNNILCQLVPGNSERNDLDLVEAHLRELFENFLAVPAANQTESLDTYFLPNFICDNVACYAYLLYANDRDITEILKIFDACLKHTRGIDYLQERFYENQIAVLQLMNERFRGMHRTLVERLKCALNSYPDNFYFLSAFAGLESELPNWKINTRKENDRPWQALSLCLAGRVRINSFFDSEATNAANASINKLINFHRELARDSETQHCPLASRLLMLLLREHNLSGQHGEEAYHQSVAQCPWTRSIYIDAAEVAPQVLTQIHDIMREKDLRMHVTPEEINILRGG